MIEEEDTQRITIKVPKQDVIFLDQLFKSYEGLTLVTHDKEVKGLIHLDVTNGTKEDILEIIADLKKRIPIVIMDS